MEYGNDTGNNQVKITTGLEFLYLYRLVRYRIRECFIYERGQLGQEPEMPELEDWQPHLARFIEENELDKGARIILLTALSPYLYPDLFDKAIAAEVAKLKDETRNPERVTEDRFLRIGGITKGKNCPFFLPTGETALFLICGTDNGLRLEMQELFGAEHIFWAQKILWLEDLQDQEPPMHGRIIMSQDYVDRLTLGIHRSPQFSISFPAKRIASASGDDDIDFPDEAASDPCLPRPPTPWDKLIIGEELKAQINEIRTWLKYNDLLVDEFDSDKQFRQGYRSLFYGPPGTGKTFTARLLGEELQRDVYKIDLSMVVSKYIGETEKNLELLFTRAQDKKWILFFDEADALFGKRTNVRDAHDKYANQEVSYLLQRIEDYSGLIILATNMKNNIDDAFVRRFDSILKFLPPNIEERKRIWASLFPKHVAFFASSNNSEPETIDIPDEVKKYELTGGNINNIVHYACLMAMRRRNEEPGNADCRPDKLIIYLDDVLKGISREMIKEGKPFNIAR